MKTIFLLLFNYKIEVLEYIVFLGILFFFIINLHRHSRNRKDKFILSYLVGIFGIILFVIGITTFLTPIGLLLTKISTILIVGAILAWMISHLMDLFLPTNSAKNSNKYNLDILTDILPKKKMKAPKEPIKARDKQ